MLKGNRKSIITLFLSFIMILTLVMPIWAENIPTPDISSWAIGTLNEGERYDIYPIEWYYENFRTKISNERLETLLENTSRKISQIGLDKKAEFTPIPYKGDGSREDVIVRLYNILVQYNLNLGKSPVEYMQERKILRGTCNGLELDKPCTTEEAVIFATRLIEDTYNLLDAGSKGFAWKVEHNGNTIYLLGSIHVGNNEIYPINQKLKEAFYNSDVLIVEANLLDQQNGLEYFMQKAMYQDGTTLKDHISKETYDKFLKVCEIYNLPAETYSQYKPWSITNDLNVITMSDSENIEEGSQAANLGIDLYFLTNALLLQKPVIELEGIKYQADLFDGLSPEIQEQYLNSMLDYILNPPDDESYDTSKLLQEWLYEWKSGNIDGFASSYTETAGESEDEYSNMLFGERDKNMAKKIVELLESDEKGTYFLVAGAGHFVMKNTIIDHLTEKGYNVELFY